MPHTAMLRRTLMASFAVIALVLGGAGTARAQIKIVMSNDNNAVGVKGQTFELLKKEIERNLGNKVKVELQHSGMLFDQKTQVQGLQLGSVNIIAPTQGIYAPLTAKINVLSLPFLLSSPRAVEAAMQDPLIRKSVLEDLEKKNIKPVAIWINGPRDLSYRGHKPVLLPADMVGMKIRVQSVPADIKTMRVLGANVSSMSWSEVPTALQQGVIDAVEPTPNALVGAGLHEMIDQITSLNYQYSFYIVSANRQWWEGLPADVRAGLEQALKVSSAWNWQNTRRENDAAYAKVARLGKKINTINAQQRAQWVAAVAPVWKEFGDDVVGPDVMKRLKEIAAANP